MRVAMYTPYPGDNIDKCLADVVSVTEADALLAQEVVLADGTVLPVNTPMRELENGFWEPIK